MKSQSFYSLSVRGSCCNYGKVRLQCRVVGKGAGGIIVRSRVWGWTKQAQPLKLQPRREADSGPDHWGQKNVHPEKSQVGGCTTQTFTTNSTTMADSAVLPPQQHSQPSRKGKKAWRKNVNVTEIETGLEEVREEIIKGYFTVSTPTIPPMTILIHSPVALCQKRLMQSSLPPT
jgi:hypothetical protein